MMRGLPAGGKSTKAKELVADGVVRVNRDLLREMMNFGAFKHEDMVVDIEQFVVRNYLSKNRDVVVDDCNLNPANEEMWATIAKENNAKFEVIYIDTDVETCIERDALREKKVGEHVIRNMALQYGLVKMDKPIVICDIDGTIADIKHRLHYVQGETKDWKEFFEAMYDDRVREDVETMLMKEVLDGHEIIFVSARPEEYRQETEGFLSMVGVKYTYLLMRPSGDKREDSIVKTNIYNKFLKNLKIVRVYDDRPRVIRMWRELGLEVVDVGDGIEF